MPWLIISLARKISPFLAKFLQYGRLNINTKRYWDSVWASGSYQETEDERHSELRNRIIELIKPESEVLDVGCGSGSLMQLLRDRAHCRCTGIDISTVSINIIREQGFEGYVTKLPNLPPEILSRKFDFVIAAEVFEHLNKPEKTLMSLQKIVKPGGKLVATVPNACMSPEETEDHVNTFTAESFQALISLYFEIETCIPVRSGLQDYLLISAMARG